jgi:hypothetical protein
VSKKGKGCLFAAGVVVLIVAALFALGPVLFWTKGQVTFVNGAHEPIRDGSFVVCKQRFELGEVEPSQRRQFQYKVNCEGDYDVTVQFASGKKLTRRIGYVTSSFEMRDTVMIKDDDVDLVTSRD